MIINHSLWFRYQFIIYHRGKKNEKKKKAKTKWCFRNIFRQLMVFVMIIAEDFIT